MVFGTIGVSLKPPSTPATMSKQHSTLLPKNGNNVERVYI